MKNKTQPRSATVPSAGRGRPAKPAAAARGRGRPESPASRETFPKRTKQPGKVGLANEARPGLGTRGDPVKAPNPMKARGAKPKLARGVGNKAHKRSRVGYQEPPPEPREQSSNSMAHELELHTGMSGQSGGV